MDDCIFCKIIHGDIPCYKVYEDDLFLGFLDIKPLNPGNTLLIPKIHYRWVNDVPEFGLYWETARKIAGASISVVKADFVSYLTLGMEVHHAHIRIIPRFYGDNQYHGIDTLEIIEQSPEQMTKLAKEISKTII